MNTNTVVSAVIEETATIWDLIQNFGSKYGVKILAVLLILFIAVSLVKLIKKGIPLLINLFDMDI